ncbi:MAG: hypothetical protein HQK83_08875 [Fibrobacteria bacterium]|nr:hypothetical protein [Fibrobacteria bacterium]
MICLQQTQTFAIPDTGYEFEGWTGALEGPAILDTLLMDSNKILTHAFSLIPPPQFTIALNTSHGNVSLDPSGGT